MADPEVFSLRIVSIDHYMAPPIADLDVCYSSFQGGKVNEVPVVRIYGSTPAGQKACMHMHGALPYLYVPYAEISIQPHDEADANPHAICIALEKALKLRSKAGSKRQHVHGCSLVRARKLYGYHPSEELFVKIYLYYPQDVSRAASLLLGGAVFNRTLQPHESHIPFLLQLMIDYNLYGMGLLHVSKIKFRHPVPGTFTPRKANCSGKQAQETKNQAGPSSCVHLSSSLVWVDSTIPSKWLWQCSGDIDASDQAIHLVKRQSTCELEGDSTVDEILNQQFNMYSSFSQTGSDVKMVQSLVPIWEEEYERTGVHELEISHKSGKPLPEDVLKILQHGLGFEKRLTELASEAKDSSPQFEEDGKPVKPMRTPTDGGNLSEHEVLKPSVDNGEDEYSKPFEGLQSDMIGTSAPKCTDKEALSLLKWLASSQAAEDVNSDDELSREMILSPLLPTISIDKVLEKATKDYESESQQECQDILDSVDLIDSEELKGKGLTDYRSNSLKQTIPQLDGSGDDQCSAASSDSSEKKINIKSEEPPKKQSDQDAAISISGKHQARKKLWGSLPFSGTQKVCDIVHFGSSNVIPAGNEGESSVASDKFKDTYFSDLKDSGSSFGSSVRDLMRKKRCQQSDPPYCRTSKVRKSILEKSEADAFVGPRLLQFETPQSWREDMSASEFPNLGLPFTDQKRQISERSPLLFCAGKQVDSLKDEGVTFFERLDDEAVKETAAGSRTISGSYQLQMETRASPVIDIENQMSLVAEATCLTNNCNEFLSTTSVESEMFNASTCRPDALVNMQSSKCTTHDKLLGHDVQQKSEAADSSKHLLEQFCRVDRWCCNNEHKCNNCFRYNPEMPSNNIGGKATTCAAVAEFERSGNPHEGGDNCRYVSGSSALRDDVVLGECTEFFGMTLFKRPPKAEFSDGSPEDAVSLPAILTLPLPKSGNDKEGTQGLGHRQHSADEFLPFFVDQDIKQAQDICDRSRNLTSNQGAQGVPTHYQNDGSLLYLLTPATSPPSRRCVSAWLSHDDIGTVRKKLDTRLVEPLIAEDRGVSSSLMGSQGCLTDASSQEIESATDNRTEHVLNQSDQLKHQDVSQISGPPGDAKPTPVSQTGFKDPASVDGCQQLTLISVEVQAESRGNLTPDPRFDAINVIAVVVQEDVDCTLDCFVLLRDDSGSHFRYLDGIPGSNATFHSEEKDLLKHFMEVIRSFDPDILMGWDVQGCSLGYLAERASNLGIGLLNAISRTPSITKTAREDSEASNKGLLGNEHSESFLDDTVLSEDVLIQDEWGRTHASGIHVGGRAVLNVWRLMRSELKLNLYTVEAVAEAVLRRKVPLINNRALTKWYSSGPGIARYRCIEYFMDRAKLNLEIINHLDLINRTSELARVFGIDFFSVLSRGSQYRVESMLLRLAHTQNYLAISPGNHQVASQPAMECLPLVMEPESGFYADPVVVLDFQSLYPSMVISYNLCFSTCLGKVLPSKENTLGVCSYSPDANVLQNLIQQILLTPNGVMYVPSKVRRGILPRLLDEILSTRIMVKHAMKKLSPSQRVLQRVFNARQLALKLIANVTYGYTAAGFSGRMPCAELADSIVQCGRRTLENAISFVNAHDKWKARVIYGDTDSMFVLLKGRTIKESFEIGQEIASAVTAMNPDPVILKLEKVYLPCFLLTKKRYTGYSYERPDQLEPIFDAKGIETVRRDTCGAVSKTMEQSLRLFFEHQDLLKVKSYLQRQWRRILSGRVSLQDFVFAKEVRLGTYSMRTSSLLPPAAIVATKAMKADPRAEPRYAERVPYVVIHGLPGARLVDMVVDPLDLLEIDSPFRLNDLYYITKQIIPALQRVFGLVKGDLNQWFSEMPRPVKAFSAARPFYAPNSHRTRIDYYYLSKHCILCGELVHASKHLCDNCSDKGIAVATAVTGRTSKLEREMQHLVAICRHCGGGDWLVESGVKCTSLACSVFFERRKVQKELQALSSIATEGGFYPRCAIEWF